jgi:hypothetical protein
VTPCEVAQSVTCRNLEWLPSDVHSSVVTGAIWPRQINALCFCPIFGNRRIRPTTAMKSGHTESLSFPIHAIPEHERNVDLGTILATLSFQPLRFAPGIFVTASTGGAARAARRTILSRFYEVSDVGVVALVESDLATSGGSFTEGKDGEVIDVAGQSVRVVTEVDPATGASWGNQRMHCQLYIWREPTTRDELKSIISTFLRELMTGGTGAPFPSR